MLDCQRGALQKLREEEALLLHKLLVAIRDGSDVATERDLAIVKDAARQSTRILSWIDSRLQKSGKSKKKKSVREQAQC